MVLLSVRRHSSGVGVFRQRLRSALQEPETGLVTKRAPEQASVDSKNSARY